MKTMCENIHQFFRFSEANQDTALPWDVWCQGMITAMDEEGMRLNRWLGEQSDERRRDWLAEIP